MEPSTTRMKGASFAVGRLMKRLQEFVAVFGGQEGIMKVDLRDPGNSAEHDFLDAGLSRGGHRDGLAVAAESSGDPENIDLLNRSRASVGFYCFPHAVAPEKSPTKKRLRLSVAYCNPFVGNPSGKDLFCKSAAGHTFRSLEHPCCITSSIGGSTWTSGPCENVVSSKTKTVKLLNSGNHSWFLQRSFPE